MEPSSDLALFIAAEAEKPVGYIVDRVNNWQQVMSPFFNEYEDYASAYRLIDLTEGSQKSNAFTKTRVGETLRSTEALTTSIFRMLTSADPPYDVLSMNGDQTQQQVYNTGLMLRYQDKVLKWKKSLLRSVRGCCLFGTTIFEKPWITKSRNGQLQYEGLGFQPRSLIQCAFDPYCLTIEDSGWAAFMDYFTEDRLQDLAETDPEHWDPDQIQKAIDEHKSAGSYSSYMEMRRRRAGYRDGPGFEVITYYGRVKGLKRDDGKLWCVRIINETHVIAAFANPSPTGEIPWGVAKYTDFELEPYGYGVGRLGSRIAGKHLDENRRRYMDTARMSLMNMWIKDRLSGVKNSDLKIKPLGIIEADDINLLKSFAPDLAGVDVGFKIEEIMRNEFQGNVGATAGLQAQVTDASATEASIAQNEAIRRISVIAEDIGESLVRDYQQDKHEYNMAWLEADLWLAVSGQEKPVRVNRRTMAPYVDIEARITTDKNFRPQRIKNIISAIQGLTSIRNRQNIRIDDTDLYKELLVALDINPRRVIMDEDNLSQQSVLSFLSANMNAAKAANSELGPAAEEANAAMGPNDNVQNTPVGPVALSPNGA